MSFQRTRYDPCEAKQSITESAQAASYPLNTPVLGGNCFPSEPQIAAQKTGVCLNKASEQRFYSGPVDVETDLLGINRQASRCPQKKFQPDAQTIKSSGDKFHASFQETKQNCNSDQLNLPSCFFSVEDTRLSNPARNIKGMTMNRFIPLILPAQEQVLFPGEYMIPSRTVIKDNHRPCIPSLKVISSELLPPAQPLPCPATSSTCAAYTAPMYQYDVCG